MLIGHSSCLSAHCSPSASHVSCSPHRQRLLSAFGEFFVSLPPRTKSNLLCVKYICTLTLRLLSVSDVNWRLAAVEPDVFRQVCRWLRSLPELLCQWEGEFPELSANILRVLVELVKRSPSESPGASSAERKESLNSRKGSGKGAIGADSGAKVVNASKTTTSGTAAAATVASPATGTPSTGAWLLDPSEVSQVIPPTLLREFFSGRGFLSLPVAAQTDAVSLLYHIPSISVEVISALAAVCSQPAALHNDVRSFIMEVSRIRV